MVLVDNFKRDEITLKDITFYLVILILILCIMWGYDQIKIRLKGFVYGEREDRIKQIHS